MAKNKTVLSFEEVSFGFGHNKPILSEVNFSVREGFKATIMGQNGAGKSTMLKLIDGEYEPTEGEIHVENGATIARSSQVMPRDKFELTVLEFFDSYLNSEDSSKKNKEKKIYDVEPRVKKILNTVNLETPLDKKICEFSGGQQARLLLASALIQEPDILLLDEPTNNLDKDGIDHLTKFLIDYTKTCLIISHDAEFLNKFTHGVLYLDIFTHKIEQYVGDYHKVVAEISVRIDKERKANLRRQRDIETRKDKVNFFAHKGGKMRNIAKKMKEEIAKDEDEMVDIRQEDKTIRDFVIPSQDFEDEDSANNGLLASGQIIEFKTVPVVKNHKLTNKKFEREIKKRQKLFISGPNGIGKSTLLNAIAHNEAKGAKITDGVTVGYYRQDFSNLNFEETVRESLEEMMKEDDDEKLYRTASQFLFTSEMLRNKVGTLSEGQKGLLMFARFVLQKPGLLILDEPTNHINFRHLPVIAKALDKYAGTMILVSHMPEFVEKIKFDEEINLGKL